MKNIIKYFALLSLVFISACNTNAPVENESPLIREPNESKEPIEPNIPVDNENDIEIIPPLETDNENEIQEPKSIIITLEDVPVEFINSIISYENFKVSETFSNSSSSNYNEIIFIYNEIENLQALVDGLSLPEIQDYSYVLKKVNDTTQIFLNPGPLIRQKDFFDGNVILNKENSGTFQFPFELPYMDRKIELNKLGVIGVVDYRQTTSDLSFLSQDQIVIFSDSFEALKTDLETYLVILTPDQTNDYLKEIFNKTINPNEILGYELNGKKIILFNSSSSNPNELDLINLDIFTLIGRVNIEEYMKISEGFILSSTGFIPDPEFVKPVNQIEFSPLDFCKLKTYLRHPNNSRTGFPYEPWVVKDQGVVRIAVIPLDFPDFPGDPDAIINLKEDVMRAEAWSEFMTSGKMVYELVFVNQWVRLPRNSDFYPTYDNPFSSTRQPWQESINQVFNAADNYIDFTNIDFAYFIFPYEALLNRPTLLYGKVNVETPLAGHIQMAVYGNENINNYYQNTFWSHMVHEILHFQGFVGHGPCHHCEMSMMTRDNGASKAVLSWEGFLAEWYGDDEVHCLTKDKLKDIPEIHLDSLDKLGGSTGFKNVMIPLSDHEIIVIEYRTDGPYSSLPPQQHGIFIYVVNTKKISNYPSSEWVSKVTDPSTYWFTLLDENNWYLFRKGQTVSYKDVSIEIIDSNVVRLSLISNE